MLSVTRERGAGKPMKCPHCERDLPVGHRTVIGGRTHHAEIAVAECPTHGRVFLMREGLSGPGPSGSGIGPFDLPDTGGDDAPVRSPNRPPRTPSSASAAVPEPRGDAG